VYFAATVGSVISLAALTNSMTTDALLGDFWSIPAALFSLLFYSALLAFCVWIRRSEHHRFAWRIAVIPNPVLVGCVALFARPIR